MSNPLLDAALSHHDEGRRIISVKADKNHTSKAGMIISTIRKQKKNLGHADVSITMRVYAHFLKPKKQDTMGDLERLIENR